jgi:tyrosinase
MANNLLYLFDRPQEPVFARKGDDETYFSVPSDYLSDRYKTIGAEVQTRFSGNASTLINVKKIALPDMRIPFSLGRNEQFSLWIPRHRKIAGRLIDIFMGKIELQILKF